MTLDNTAIEVKQYGRTLFQCGAIFHTGEMERERSDSEMSNIEQTLTVVARYLNHRREWPLREKPRPTHSSTKGQLPSRPENQALGMAAHRRVPPRKLSGECSNSQKAHDGSPPP